MFTLPDFSTKPSHVTRMRVLRRDYRSIKSAADLDDHAVRIRTLFDPQPKVVRFSQIHIVTMLNHDAFTSGFGFVRALF